VLVRVPSLALLENRCRGNKSKLRTLHWACGTVFMAAVTGLQRGPDQVMPVVTMGVVLLVPLFGCDEARTVVVGVEVVVVVDGRA
jgi:hypothetical protein